MRTELRLPDTLAEQVKALAKANNRSMNAQIEWILKNVVVHEGKRDLAEDERPAGKTTALKTAS